MIFGGGKFGVGEKPALVAEWKTSTEVKKPNKVELLRSGFLCKR
jgi:hypothetical protein